MRLKGQYVAGLLLLITLWSGPAHGVERDSVAPVSRVGAQTMALGGAVVALPGVSETWFANPAALATVYWPEITGGWGQQDTGGLMQTHLTASMLVAGRLVAGLGMVTLSDPERLAGSERVQAALGFPLSRDGSLMVGLAGKILRQDGVNEMLTGAGVDVGLLFSVFRHASGRSLGLGLSLLDAQTILQSDRQGEIPLPTRYAFGVAYHFTGDTRLVLGYEIIQTRHSEFEEFQLFRSGLEHVFHWPGLHGVALRAGYLQRTLHAGLLTAGLGVEFHDWKLDYAVQVPSAFMDAFHQLSLSWGFKRETASRTPLQAEEPTRAVPADTPKVDKQTKRLFSALESAAEAGESTDIFQFDEPSVKPQPTVQASSPVDKEAEEESGTYRLPVPKGPSDQESVSSGIDPEMPAFFSGRFSGLRPGGQQLDIANQDLRLHAVVNPFSPNQDGRLDRTIFVGRLTTEKFQVARWVLNIFRGSDIVKTFKGGSRLPRNLEWDGKDQQGKKLSDGDYDALLRVMNENGLELASATQRVTIRTKPRPVALTGPETVVLTGQGDKAIDFSAPAQNGSSQWRFTISGNRGRRVFERQGEKEFPSKLTWPPAKSNAPLAAGKYQARLTYRDDAGVLNESNWDFRLKEANVNLALKASPELFAPAPQGGESVKFEPAIEGDLQVKSWRMEIIPEKESRPFMVFRGESALPGTLIWDGRSADGQQAEAGKLFRAELTVVTALGTEATAESGLLKCDLSDYAGTQALSINLVRVGFDAGSLELSESAKKNLTSAVDTLQKYTSDYQLRVAGYCDSQEATGRELALSGERARVVAEFLIGTGKIPEAKITRIGRGSSKPLAKEDTAEGQAKNRRVEVVLLAQ